MRDLIARSLSRNHRGTQMKWMLFLGVFNGFSCLINISLEYPAWRIAICAFVSGVCLASAFFQWTEDKREAHK